MKDESVWLTQKAMGELSGVQTPAINKHLINIYDEGELSVERTVSKMEIVQNEGTRQVRRMVDFYNLDAITGHTAAELIFNNTDSSKENMGYAAYTREQEVDYSSGVLLCFPRRREGGRERELFICSSLLL